MVRENKGKSLLIFPEDYVVIDIETTGLDPDYDAIIEVAAVKYKKGEQVGTFQTLVNPETTIGTFIQELTGITNEMLVDAPLFEDIVEDFLNFIEDLPILGYNVHFDINFLYDNTYKVTGYGIRNNIVDIMRFARRMTPELKKHRLSDMVKFYGITHEERHRALGDCLATQDCYACIQQQIIAEHGSIQDFVSEKISGNSLEWKYKGNGKHKKSATPNDLVADPTKIDETSLIFGKVVVLSGELPTYTRVEAWQLIKDLGGIPEKAVTKRTDFLVLGGFEHVHNIKGGKSSKHKKAEALIEKGQKISIISGKDFLEVITESKN